MKFQSNNLQLKKGENMAKENLENKEKRNPILFFLFAVVIPLLIVSVIAVVILSLVGVDVSGWAKEKGSNIPVVSSFVESEEEEQLQAQLDRANETIELQVDEIDELNKEIDSLEAIREDLQLEITRLENRNQSEEGLLEESDETEVVDEMKQAASSFRKMDPENAAQIVQNLDQATAVAILTNLSGDVRGAILAEMEPNQAAELVEALTN